MRACLLSFSFLFEQEERNSLKKSVTLAEKSENFVGKPCTPSLIPIPICLTRFPGCWCAGAVFLFGEKEETVVCHI